MKTTASSFLAVVLMVWQYIMTINRQPGRPSIPEFIVVGTRLEHDEYEPTNHLIATQYDYGDAAISAEMQRRGDKEIVRQEYLADGIVPGLSLMDFARKQLTYCRKAQRKV